MPRTACGRAVSAPETTGDRAEPRSHTPFTRRALRELLWEDAGLVRDERGLQHAAALIAGWRAEHRSPITEAQLEDENLLLVGERLVAAALARTASVGAHFRSDDSGNAEPSPGRVRRGGIVLTRAIIDRAVAAALEEDAPWGDIDE